MEATCGKCGAHAAITPMAGKKFSTSYMNDVHLRCQVLANRLQEKGHLSGKEMDCEHIERAIAQVIDSLRHRH